jgi:hypothetical protein
MSKYRSFWTNRRHSEVKLVPVLKSGAYYTLPYPVQGYGGPHSVFGPHKLPNNMGNSSLAYVKLGPILFQGVF